LLPHKTLPYMHSSHREEGNKRNKMQ